MERASQITSSGFEIKHLRHTHWGGGAPTPGSASEHFV